MDEHIPSHLKDYFEDSEQMRKWKMNERFDIEHRALNRHDRRAIKAKYRKRRK